jgi:hypothetical protein
MNKPNKARMETKSSESSINEIPLKSVKSFGQIQFDQKSTVLPKQDGE